ncbi:MAG: hypothetical protein ACI3WU_05745 [Phascolarctobacterium sp.]
MNTKALQMIKDKEIIGKMITKSRYYRNLAIERREGADARMQKRASIALRFVLR